MQTFIVYQEDGVYAGWPANHGAWQWGDELLVGFMRGQHKKVGMHNIVPPFQKVLSRSLDGGKTWTLEVPNVDFEGSYPRGVPFPTPSDEVILRFCGGYDHGGELCDSRGAVYWSSDRGHTWRGPAFVMPEIRSAQPIHCTTRTCVLGDLMFLSTANTEHWGSDCTFCCRVENGHLSSPSLVLGDEYRAVMPAVAKVGGRIVAAIRRRGPPRVGCWIDSVFSDDEGETWSDPVHVADTGESNGNPPALIERDGTLYCAYANRSDKILWVSKSIDAGLTWGQHAILNSGSCSDVGYPRLFKRTDGTLVCVYYWSAEGEPQHILATHFD